jgi:hypothetical protein
MNQSCVSIHSRSADSIHPFQGTSEPLKPSYEASSSAVPACAQRCGARRAVRRKGRRFICPAEPVCLRSTTGTRPVLELILYYRRAKTLNSYAGDTALPGGRIDDADKTIEDTAVRLYTTFFRYFDCDRQGFPQFLKRREAFEEVPISRTSLLHRRLC